MKFELNFTEAGVNVSSDGIPIFRVSAHSMQRSFPYLRRTFEGKKTVDADTFLTVLKVLKSTWRAPEYVVNLVLKNSPEVIS